MPRWMLTTLVLTFSGDVLGHAAEPLPTCLGGLDPVMVAAGQRTPGKAEFAAGHGRFQYLFATPDNLAAFLKEPDRYAVQYAGACAKMGPLTGLGQPERFVVHGGRIYLFASESCQSAFEKSPDSFVERDDQPPGATDESLARGRQLVALALRGFGGEDRVDAVRTLTLETRRPYRDGDQTREHSIVWTAAFPARFARSDAWHGAKTAMVVVGDRGWYRGTTKVETYQEIERRFLRREFRRMPLVLLKARSEQGFQAVAAGRGKVGDRDVELLTIHLDGINHALGLDPATGRVLSMGYRGRLVGPIVPVVKTYDDFRDVQADALSMAFPFVAAAGEEGQEPVAKTTFAHIAINAEPTQGLFEQAP